MAALQPALSSDVVHHVHKGSAVMQVFTDVNHILFGAVASLARAVHVSD